MLYCFLEPEKKCGGPLLNGATIDACLSRVCAGVRTMGFIPSGVLRSFRDFEIVDPRRIKFTLRDTELLFAPAINTGHWSINVIDVKNGSITQLDSMNGGSSTPCNTECRIDLMYVELSCITSYLI